jgi:hypothetical protein
MDRYRDRQREGRHVVNRVRVGVGMSYVRCVSGLAPSCVAMVVC